ncbi:phytanoyl-CoA dioxygenase family protein [Pedobacter xixiisoli]|uniref:Phytanoyl-CoA dioxygenase (PhyH) n=1 Tax=Pedobacter xixiisoli TaxID=1476464 RepID=A0A285ZZI6_9SPHI|nr:phytanoyl-CoA dioxygenase family protein [Pedobacter xixiisoli]SOD15045.1 Phytanoyl-CoA dioxygenase (PhyH) [Pedobacter xixiisoli]
MEVESSNSLKQSHFSTTKLELEESGFSIVNDIYTPKEIEQILAVIAAANSDKATFRKSEDLFAIRQFLKEVPEIESLIFNDNLKDLLVDVFNNNAFVVKSIYFDKPEKSNWYVAYHQDLTISVDKKVELEGFGPWTVKQEQFAVQPPLAILKRDFTIRIHLDNTSINNGALKVIPKSHLKGIYRPETIDWNVEKEAVCEVQKGGVMLMKPLILHSSNRTTNGQKRRVIHIEFSDVELPEAIQWSERLN